jgi:hypothetical protein
MTLPIIKRLAAGALIILLAACSPPTATPEPTPLPPTAVPPTEAPPPTTAPSTGANAVPAVQLVALQEGTTFVQGQQVGVAVLAADSDGIMSAGLVVDGEVVSTLEGTSGQIFQGTLTWTPDTPGEHLAGVIVYDTSGGVADIAARRVIVLPAGTAAPPPTEAPAGDTTPPAVSITPLQTTVTAGQDIDVAVNAVDESGVVKLELYGDGTVRATWNYDPSTGPAPQSAFQTLVWRNASAGSRSVYVTATDSAGNVGQSVTETVTVTAADSAAPESTDTGFVTATP